MTTRFVRTLQQNIRAVEAAVTEPWGNGPSRDTLTVENSQAPNVWTSWRQTAPRTPSARVAYIWTMRAPNLSLSQNPNYGETDSRRALTLEPFSTTLRPALPPHPFPFPCVVHK